MVFAAIVLPSQSLSLPVSWTDDRPCALQADPEVQRKFRAIIYESRWGQRTDIIDDTDDVDDGTSPTEWGKLKHAQQEYLRAADRAAEAIPTIGELLDRGLISIKVAALLAQQGGSAIASQTGL